VCHLIASKRIYSNVISSTGFFGKIIKVSNQRCNIVALYLLALFHFFCHLPHEAIMQVIKSYSLSLQPLLSSLAATPAVETVILLALMVVKPSGAGNFINSL